MLTVAKVARGRERYYLDAALEHSEAALGDRTSPGPSPRLREPPGYWLGRGAEELGLRGEVEAAALGRVLAGTDPDSGELLSFGHLRVSVAGFDCTFSAPKSVSLLHALGSEEVASAVREAQRDAVAAVLGYLEHEAGALRRRSGGRLEVVPAEGLAAACFVHRVSRALDPHLHTHVVIANLGADAAGRWSALDGRPLFASLAVARDLYDAHLRAALGERLECRWGRQKGAAADLEGLDEAVVAAFSRRRDAIRGDLEARGASGRRASVVSGHRTRPPKKLELSYEELVGRWRDRALSLGLSDRRLARIAPPRSSPVGPFVLPEGAVRTGGASSPSVPSWCAAAVGPGGGADVATYGALVRARCRGAAEGVRREVLEADIAGLLAHGVLVQAVDVLGPQEAAGGRAGPRGREALLTTPEVLGEIAALEAAARRAAEAGRLEALVHAPGDRLGVLDGLAALGAGPRPAVVVASSPGDAARAEAATGLVATTASSWLAARERAPEGPVVLLDAHRFRVRELRRLLEAPSRSPLLFVACEGRDLRRSVVGPVLRLASPAPLGARLPTLRENPALVAGGGPVLRLEVGGEDVVVSADPAAVRQALVADARRAVAEGLGVALAVPNRAAATALSGELDVLVEGEGARATARAPRTPGAAARAGAPAVLVSPAARLARARGAEVLLSLGGAAVEPRGEEKGRTAPLRIRRYLVVAGADARAAGHVGCGEEAVGRILESVAPRELCSRLGPPPDGLAERAAWRRAAVALDRRGLVVRARPGPWHEPARETALAVPDRGLARGAVAREISRPFGR